MTRVLRHYLAAWHAQRVLMIGYSFGADVLPFVVNRLPPDVRAQVASVSLLGLDAHASFEIHLAEWVSDTDAGPATRPACSVTTLEYCSRLILCIWLRWAHPERWQAFAVHQIGRAHV